MTVVGKGRKRRTVGLNEAAVGVLEQVKSARGARPTDLVFVAPGGWELSRYILGRRIGETFRNSGLPGGGPHALRHFFATQLLMRGVPIIKVSILLGHSLVTTTQRHYSHILSSDLTGVTDVLAG